jgi:hypothetical protein
VDTRAADNREVAQGAPPAGTRAGGTVVDQAIRAAVLMVRQVVPSPDNAPDVVAHQPILSSGGAFLNVLPISGA